MRTQLDLDEFIPTMDTPEKVYQLFDSLGYKVLDSRLKTNPSVYNLPFKEAALVEKIFAVSNYDRRFQILLFKLKEESKEAIRTIPEKILREVDFPFIIFTPDFKTYTFTLVEKVREGPGEFKRKLTKLVVDSTQPYHTDKEILTSLTLSSETKNPVEVYKLFQSAFSVEKVTKKFFTEYREVFERLVKEITKQNKHLKFTLFSRDGSVENFVKILLGRLMFLYFIQKRGWLNCFDGWGSGDKKFLFNKFQEAKKDKKNYFKDYLEPLFFDTLNNPRRDKPDQATQFGGRIPFLNGGLFEPEYDYQDVRNHILLENSTFDDVFSVFEKYNFTVKEDEPLEKEVAIDPEMLGKVFENLLEENLRKGKGTYYTPREIVHYMCHESLINYLASEVGIEQEEIRNFLDREQSLEKKETLSPLIKGKAKELDEKLADIKVLDPACGSGAFLVGMLHEIINARLSLNRELGRSLSEYELKKTTIQNNIYGVDIDPGAAEIAKLRLWLTLVVDHNLSEIEPLPNLDYKIMVGNSLLDEFMGVKLFNLEKARERSNGKRMLKLFEDDIQQVELFQEDNKSSVLKALQEFHALYFKESDPEKKKQIRTQIDKIEFDLIETTVKDEVKKLEDEISHITSNPMLKGLGIPKEIADKITKISSKQAQILETFNEIKKSNVKPFFLFQLHFSDVFERKGGFDVVIANPPYVSFGLRGVGKTNNGWVDSLRRIYPNSAEYKLSLYAIFMDRGLQLLGDDGVLTYVTPDSFLLGRYFSKLRRYILDSCRIIEILMFEKDFWESGVVGRPVISLLERYLDSDVRKNNIPTFKLYRSLDDFNKNIVKAFSYPQSYFEKTPYNRFRMYFDDVSKKLADHIEEGSVELSDLVTIHTGVRSKIGQKNIVSDKKEGINWQKGLISGSEIEKYFVHYEGNFINIDPKLLWSGGWDPKIILNDKLLLRQTGDSLVAAFDGNKYYHLNNLHSIASKDGQSKTLKFVLALLNSKLLNFYYRLISLETGRTMAQTDIETLELLPVKTSTDGVKEEMISLIDQILLSNGKKDLMNGYQQKIDQLVYQLYDLTPKEIAVVEGKNEN